MHGAAIRAGSHVRTHHGPVPLPPEMELASGTFRPARAGHMSLRIYNQLAAPSLGRLKGACS